MIYWRYLLSLLKHKWYIFRAGRLLRVPFWRLLIHDWSKFTRAEFGSYARWHFGGKKNRAEWAAAWHHHQQCNAHHPEFYLLAWRGELDFYDGIAEPVSDFIAVLPATETYVREMVADWLAASKTYTGKWDIAVWLNREGRKMILHQKTADYIASIMCELGYCVTDNCDWSWMAGNAFRDWAKEHV